MTSVNVLYAASPDGSLNRARFFLSQEAAVQETKRLVAHYDRLNRKAGRVTVDTRNAVTGSIDIVDAQDYVIALRDASPQRT